MTPKPKFADLPLIDINALDPLDPHNADPIDHDIEDAVRDNEDLRVDTSKGDK